MTEAYYYNNCPIDRNALETKTDTGGGPSKCFNQSIIHENQLISYNTRLPMIIT